MKIVRVADDVTFLALIIVSEWNGELSDKV